MWPSPPRREHRPWLAFINSLAFFLLQWGVCSYLDELRQEPMIMYKYIWVEKGKGNNVWEKGGETYLKHTEQMEEHGAQRYQWRPSHALSHGLTQTSIDAVAFGPPHIPFPPNIHTRKLLTILWCIHYEHLLQEQRTRVKKNRNFYNYKHQLCVSSS